MGTVLRIVLLIVAMVVAHAAASAQDVPAPADFTFTGGATLATDYRYRGISRSDRRVAVQGTATVSHGSGFYVGTWASSIDDYVARGGDAEIDLFAGYKQTYDGTTIDGGVLYYYYPGARGSNTDFFEPYLSASRTYGPVSLKVGGNLAWKQRGLAAAHSRDGAAYLYGELAAGIPGTGVTLTGHVGHSFVRSAITFDRLYSDWSVTAAYSWKVLTFSAAYVDTDKNIHSYPLGGGRDRLIGGAGVVGSVALAF